MVGIGWYKKCFTKCSHRTWQKYSTTMDYCNMKSRIVWTYFSSFMNEHVIETKVSLSLSLSLVSMSGIITQVVERGSGHSTKLWQCKLVNMSTTCRASIYRRQLGWLAGRPRQPTLSKHKQHQLSNIHGMLQPRSRITTTTPLCEEEKE